MYSISGQDQFVLDMIPKGTFLEIGAHEPIAISNTYLLELNGWDGLSIDIDDRWKTNWQLQRRTPLIISNALTYKYEAKHYDYISLDIEPAILTLKALKRILKRGVTFSILTFEHEWYYDQSTKFESRQILLDAGYHLAKPDVQWSGGIYEDWWIDPKRINIEKAESWIK
jgi:hypothetical protein